MTRPGRGRDTVLGWAVAAAIAAALLLSMLKLQADPSRTNGIYYQGTTSERLMQTVSALDLAREPGLSLWYLHIQPPLFDAIRMVAAVGFDGHPKRRYEDLNLHVDLWLYRAWLLVYALIVGLSAYWLGLLTSPRFGALSAIVVVAVHPASVFYATFLDSTILGALATVWLSFEVWAAREQHGSVARLTGATLLACLARSHFPVADRARRSHGSVVEGGAAPSGGLVPDHRRHARVGRAREAIPVVRADDDIVVRGPGWVQGDPGSLRAEGGFHFGTRIVGPLRRPSAQPRKEASWLAELQPRPGPP